MRLVLVDDSAVACEAFERFADAAGYEVVAVAADAASGLAHAERLTPDALVVDGRLGVESIAAFVALVRDRCPAIEVFVLAALDERALVRSALDAGAAGALVRPVLPSQLARVLGARGVPDVDDAHIQDASRPDFAN